MRVPGRPRSAAPSCSNLGSQPRERAHAHGARPGVAHTHPPAPALGRRLRPGTRKVGGAAAPPRRGLRALPPAPRPLPASRAVLPGPAPGPGRPRGHPTGRSSLPTSLRGLEGTLPPGLRRSRAGSRLSSATLPPGTPRSASALADRVRQSWGPRVPAPARASVSPSLERRGPARG